MPSEAEHRQPAPPSQERLPQGCPWWRLCCRKPLGAISGLLLCGLMAVACLAPALAPYDPYRFNLNVDGVPVRRQAPNARFVFGTDAQGRDVLSRMIYGTRVSFLVGVVAVAIGTGCGILIGLVAGCWEGKVDQGLQCLTATLMAVPGLVLALVVLCVLGQHVANVILALGLSIALGASLVVRGAVLMVKHSSYIDAALAAGASSWRILWRHILPQVCVSLVALASAWLSQAIVLEATLSFLGFGIPPPIPTWGGMLSGAGRRGLETAPHLALLPGLALSLVMLALHLFGRTIRDLLKPRLRLH